MANPWQQILPTTTGINNNMLMSTPDANGATAYATMGRDVSQGQLWLVANGKMEFIMGLQSRNARQTNGGEFMASAGNDWLEPRFRIRQWGGSMSRWVPRGQDLESIIKNLFGSPIDIDFRKLPLQWHYLYNQQSDTGAVIETVSWDYLVVYVTDYEISEPDSTGKQMENITWIGKGQSRHTGGTMTMQNEGTLWFSQSQPPSTQSGTSASNSAVSNPSGIQLNPSGGVYGGA